ncbi:MAG: GGDEF domain-containing protein [Rhodospirillales bacterium]
MMNTMATTSPVTGDVDLVTAFSRIVSSLGRTASRRDAVVRDAIMQEMLALAATAQSRMVDQSRRIRDLEQLAHSDELTALHNRRAFMSELRLALAHARRYSETGAVIFVDLDGFKEVNDHYGHAAGDAVLQQVGSLLRDLVRETDIVGRIGGDEFAILLTRASTENAFRRAKVIEKALNSAVATFGSVALPISASFGIEMFCGRDDEAVLLDRADQAMYRQKRARKGANENCGDIESATGTA